MSQLKELATPFSGQYVKKAPQGKYGDYVSHSVVNQRALSVVGPHSFEVVEIIRDKDGNVSGVLGRLSVVIDGQHVVVTEAGDEEHPDQKRDGEAVKNAASDAYKRCWMRLGLGLHLWSQEDYFLRHQLEKHDPMDKFDILEQRDGAGRVVRRINADTGEELPLSDGQLELVQSADHDWAPGEEPFA